MKREYPALYEKVSIWIVTPLIYVWMCVYLQRAFINPGAEIYSLGMAAFGITAGLSGVCFAMAAVSGVDTAAATYAGEKFLHSAILLVQTLLVVSIRDAVLDSDFGRAHSSFGLQTKGIAAALLSFVGVASVWTWHHGFTDLNKALWKSWEHRVHEFNQRNQAQAPKSAEPNAAQDAREGAARL